MKRNGYLEVLASVQAEFCATVEKVDALKRELKTNMDTLEIRKVQIANLQEKLRAGEIPKAWRDRARETTSTLKTVTAERDALKVRLADKTEALEELCEAHKELSWKRDKCLSNQRLAEFERDQLLFAIAKLRKQIAAQMTEEKARGEGR
jgi:chromosome segregation ATPase